MSKLLAYKNDKYLKDKFVAEIKWHEKQDKFIQGTYSSNGKYCAVGCSIKSLNKLNGTLLQTNNHKAYEEYLGLPEWLAKLEDTIFEGLSTEEAKKWTLKFSKAIPVGADLEPVKYHFAIYLMKENIARVNKLDIDNNLKKQVLDAIKGSMKVNQDALDTGVWDESAAESVAESAESAESAALSAARSAKSALSTRSAAESTRSAAWSARSAAESTRSAAWSALSARSAAYTKYSKKLLKLLKAKS